MVADLRRMGIEGITFYVHHYYDHPKAHDYVAEADTGYDHQNVLWEEIGNVACMDCDAWVNLYKSKYIPGYEELGVSGASVDQGPTQYLVCTKEGHRHGTDAVGMLGAHVRGELNLIKEWRAGFKKRKPFFWTEGGSDIQTRTMDIWSSPHSTPYTQGGVSKNEIVRYTFPYRLSFDDAGATPDEINRALVNGFILGGWVGDVQPRVLARFTGSPEMLSALRQFVKMRRALRQEKAPGFPNGFRDDVGLRVEDPRLVARAYRDTRGITVVYYGKEALGTTVQVDKGALDFPGKGPESFRVSVGKNGAGYKILLA
jgi:hypothetical protein